MVDVDPDTFSSVYLNNNTGPKFVSIIRRECDRIMTYMTCNKKVSHKSVMFICRGSVE